MAYPRRKPHRLYGYDYSRNGCYYITLCTHKRQQILSDICRGGVLLRPIGHIVEAEINNLKKRFNIEIDPYVIMPDHVHMIIIINRSTEREEQSPSPTDVRDIMCAFKSLTTKIANKFDNCPGRKIWQRDYYDHIIRNEHDYDSNANYIINNPITKYIDDDIQ